MEFISKPLKLDWDKELPKYYVDNNVFKTHFFNALSITFPTGERFFIESVKAVQDKVDDKLSQYIDTFIKQENWHGYAHNQYNIWLSKQGIPLEKLENRVLKPLNFVKKSLTNKQKLTTTVCIEHMSTLITVYLLTYPEILNSMDPHFRQVWIWHSVEEIEHKSVAMDTLNATCTFTMNLRRLNMIFTTCYATWVVFSITWSLLNADKQLWKWKTFKDATSFMFNKKNGFIRKSFKPWFNFMSYNFHPNNHDHTNLLKKYSK